ncbi:PEPxxWA-CTERM sorting domain-containing protein [Sandarakinorhabdus oryzae]|uniref:PEPxxWA-CTERM sorting domain-containing protein n=1 Tax=Sandarakinorhabdus oryzae TaxID=2675220 RepID=UPI001F287A63|nr:PEPxxWA-CTERM sorting domain-containing protein [Sandarakinorhabdus oryzae]
MKIGLSLAALAAGLLAAPAIAAPQTLTFDDISGTPTVTEYLNPNVAIFANYGGLTWGPRWAAVDGFGECGANPCGFKNDATSGNFTATNAVNTPNTITSPTPFRLLSIQLGAAWHDQLTIGFVGKLAGNIVWTANPVANAFGPTLFTFPSGLVDTLEVTPVITGNHVYTLGSGPRMVWDDFTFDAAPVVGGVPEPAAWALLLAGFGLVGSAARRHRSVAA